MWCIQVSCGRAQSSSDSWAPELELKEDEHRWTLDELIWKRLKEQGRAPAKGDPFWSSFQQLRRDALSTAQHQRPGARVARSQLWTVTSCIFLLLPDFSRIFLLKAHGERHPQHKESANSTVFLLLSCDLNLLNRSLLVFYQHASSLFQPSLTQLHSWRLSSCNSMGRKKLHIFPGFHFLKRFERICGFIGPQWIVTLLTHCCKKQRSWCDFSGMMCLVLFTAPATQDGPLVVWCELNWHLVQEHCA